MARTDPDTCKLSKIVAAQASGPNQPQIPLNRPTTLLLVAGAYLLGGGGMLAWVAFVVLGPWPAVDLGLGPAGRLAADGALCLLFFVQHSIMVRSRFRLRLARMLHPDLHGAWYATVSGSCLLLLVVCWQPVATLYWNAPGSIVWALYGLMAIAGFIGWWGIRSLGDFDALGVRPALRAMARPTASKAPAFRVSGPYRWVRHPLYLVSLMVIWAGPVFSVDRLVHNVLFSVWIVIGTRLEEGDLAACFGSAYRAYQKQVPMLLPKSLKPLVPSGHEILKTRDG